MGGKQLGFSDYELVTAKKRTKREKFLAEMEAAVPWQALMALIEPNYPKASKKGGRPPYPLATMLRIHLLQQWYSLSDPAMEVALIEVPTMRQGWPSRKLVGVISPPACPTPTAYYPLAGLVVTTGFCLGCLLFGSGSFLLPLGGLGGCSLSFQFGFGLADPLQTAAAPLKRLLKKPEKAGFCPFLDRYSSVPIRLTAIKGLLQCFEGPECPFRSLVFGAFGSLMVGVMP
jgi:IS5 family transposase